MAQLALSLSLTWYRYLRVFFFSFLFFVQKHCFMVNKKKLFEDGCKYTRNTRRAHLSSHMFTQTWWWWWCSCWIAAHKRATATNSHCALWLCGSHTHTNSNWNTHTHTLGPREIDYGLCSGSALRCCCGKELLFDTHTHHQFGAVFWLVMRLRCVVWTIMMMMTTDNTIYWENDNYKVNLF